MNGYVGQTSDYGQSAKANTVAMPSLLSDSANVAERLFEIEKRLIALGDQLLGPEPRDASAKENAPEPIPTVRRNIDKAQHMCSRVIDALSRIEARA